MDENDRQEGMENDNEPQAPEQPTPDTPETPDYEMPEAESFMNPEAPEPESSDTEGFEAEPQPEGLVSDPDVEPETSAFPASQEAASTPEASSSPQPLEPQESHLLPATAPSMGLSPNKGQDKKRLGLIIAASVLLLVLVGAAIWWLLASKKDTTNERASNTSSAPIEQPKLGVAVTVADGTVEYKRSEGEWQTVDTSTQLQEGDIVRTGEDSRAVITVDDGSAVRLGATTTVELVSLAANKIEVKQVDGVVYSRVVPSERKYIVSVDETTYQAMGTAFLTIKKQGENGVQVYQSSVKASTSTETISEGNQYYSASSDAQLLKMITPINIDALAGDSFIGWNLSEDEKDALFKERMGVLSQIKQRAEEIKKEHQAEKAKKEAEKEAAEKSAQEKEEAEKKRQSTAAGTKITRGDMALRLTGSNTLSWSYTGKAVFGYKVVYSKSSPAPTLGVDEAIYFADMNETNGSFPKKDQIGGGRYRVRVCAYTNGTEVEPCVDYSNIVYINL